MQHFETSPQQFFAAKSFFVESGTYQQPVLRSYQTNFDDTIVQRYLSNTENGTQIVPNAFADISSSILKPSAAPTALINIDNGWQERRMSFIIEILVPDAFTGDAKSIVFTGYTNHTDISPISKLFDPNMRMYFNTSTVISTITQRAPNGVISKRKSMLDSSHLLDHNAMYNLQATQQDQYGESALWYATPRNVINEMANISNHSNSRNVFDFRAKSGAMDLQRSRRENTVPTTYLSKILRGVHNNVNEMQYGIEEDETVAFNNAAVGVQEYHINEDPVLMEILMQANYSQQGFATWAQLCNIVPNLSDVTLFTTRASKVVQTNLPDAESGNFSHWTGVGAETMIANNIAQLVPALMTTCMIGTITFAFNNDNLNLMPTIKITNGQSMIDGIHISQVSSNFENRFLTEIAPQLTDQNRSIVNMIVQCGLGTETYISISRNGEAEVPFCAPTFCDALYSPILATSQQGVTNIASDLQNIANSVNNAQTAANYNRAYSTY